MFRRFFENSQSETKSDVEEEFCLIRWMGKKGFDVVRQKQIKIQTGSIELYETYMIDMNGNQRKGKVILKGSKHDCEKLQSNLEQPSSSDTPVEKYGQESQSTTKIYHTASSASDVLNDVNEDSKHEINEKEEKALRQAVFMKLLQLVISGSSNENDKNGEIHKVRCAGCRTYPIRSDRYTCLNCEKVNLCAQCFERRRESTNHKSGHGFVHFKSPNELFGRTVTDEDVTLSKLKEFYRDDVHESISCDGCGRESLKGLRFKCDTCPNYDLCERCFKNGKITKTHQSTHPLLLISCQPIQTIPIDDIELGDQLGKGAFGAVFKGKWISKKRSIACKQIIVPRTKVAEILEKSFLKEISAYAELSGAYILKIYGISATIKDTNKVYMLIMEYMARGSLLNLIKKENDISLRRKLDMALNIASGMRKIHEHQMIHRDIRPDNILVNENYIAKIGDMGIARVVDPLNQHTQIGCQPYMPPEFYRGDYDQKLDIFTFGLTLNELFTCKQHVFQPFMANKICFLEKSPIFSDLIARCTVDDPKRRPTAIEIEKTLDLYSIGFKEIVLKKHPRYMTFSTKDKDEIFVAFYEKFHPSATEFIRKKFPPEYLENPDDTPGVKVDKNANEQIRIECPMQ